MRGTVRNYEFGQYRFDVEFDAGAGPDDQYTVWVYDDKGDPVLQSNGRAVRRYFADFIESHVRNFCRKFAMDASYRDKYLTK